MKKTISTQAISHLCAILFAVVCLFNIISCASSDSEHVHIFGEWEIVDEATCEHDGSKVRTCETCDETEEEVIPKICHDYLVDKGYPATTDTTGLTDGAHCSICGKVLVEQVEIAKLKEEDYGYRIAIGSDEHVSVYVYDTQDYSAEPVLTNLAFARDSASGELSKDGSGQVNFELRFDEGYYLKDINISSGYNALKLPSETGNENTYRITKITNELVVFVTSQKQLELNRFSSFTDNDGNITFSWQRDDRIEYTMVRVNDGERTEEFIIDGGVRTWSFERLDKNVPYQFEFTPCGSEDTIGKTTTCTRYYDPNILAINYPKLEITTQDFVWPTCEYVPAPENCNGSSITNNNYEQCVISLFDSNNNAVYESSTTADYAQAKVKIRGNTSAYGEKKPYKIKLSKKSDLLASFMINRGENDAHKEWLLLKSGYNVNTIVGWSLSETLQMDYTPAYVYCALYFNGDYRGMYILCESVSQGSGVGDDQTRCAIENDGFIVECDAYWWNEDLYFTTPLNHYKQRYTFKYPDPDNLTVSSEEYNYIFNYISEFEAALLRDDGSYKDYIDVTTFAKWLLAHDILGSGDPAGSNIYLTKRDSTAGSELRMGPLWDFDSITLYVNRYALIHDSPIFYFPKLLNKSEFVNEYINIFCSIKDIIVENIYSKIDNLNSQTYNSLIDIENVRWNISYAHIEDNIEEIVSKIMQQLVWLENELL